LHDESPTLAQSFNAAVCASNCEIRLLNGWKLKIKLNVNKQKQRQRASATADASW